MTTTSLEELRARARSATGAASANAWVELANAVRAMRMFPADGRRTVDDVSTKDLEYVLAEKRAAEAMTREGRVERAMEASEDFLELARALGCVPRDESEACEEILRGRDEEATTSGGGGGARRDPRMDKVRRFKMKGRLRAKRERLEAALARRRGEASEDEDEDEDGPDAEELERDLRLCDIEEAVYDALDEIPAMRVEFEMLSRRDELRDSLERERERMEREDERTKRREPEIFTIDRDAASGAIRVDPRERLRSEVFRPTVALPTMTVEQAGEIERAEMLARSAREAEHARARELRRESKTADESEEEALQKARSWDAFKDDNPYGSGNSRLRPCG